MSVVNFNGPTTLPVPCGRVLNGATEAELSEVLVLGWDQDGQLYLAMSHSDLGGLLLLMERAKKCLLEHGE